MQPSVISIILQTEMQASVSIASYSKTVLKTTCVINVDHLTTFISLLYRHSSLVPRAVV